MDVEKTPRDVLKAFMGGEAVDADELRVAVSMLLTAWEQALAAGADLTQERNPLRRWERLHHLLNRIVWLDGDLDEPINFAPIFALAQTYDQWLRQKNSGTKSTPVN